MSSCASTQKAWSQFKPTEFAYIHTNGIDPEPMLINKKVKYYCNKVSYSSDNTNKACYVEKTLAQKTNEFAFALENTPKALAKDIIVVGSVTLQALALFLGGNVNY